MTILGSSIRLALATAGLALLSNAALAQAAAPAAPAASPKSGEAAERMQKAANQPLYWIKVLADKPAPKAASKPAAPATAQAAAPTPRPVATAAVAPANPAAGSVVRPARQSDATVVAAAAPSPAPAPALALDAAPMETGGGTPAGAAVGAVVASGGDAAPAVAAVAGIAAPGLAPGAALATVPMPEMDPEPDAGLVLMSAVDPEFPQAAMRRLRKGSVEVRFEVAAEGQVTDVSVLKTSNKQLDDAAMDAVRKWKFKPSNRGHAASVELAFNLDT